MEKKFGKLVLNVGKNAKDFLEKSKDITIQVADQNADGKFDLEDVSVIAGSVGNVMKKGAQTLKETTDEKARQLELKTLQPIFLETLNDTDFLMSRFIRITDRDKKHAESEVCKGSIGFLSDQKGLHIVNIFRDSIDSYGLSFYPDCDSEFYYVDPSDRDSYIALDEYFNYLKQVRISELQKIAQDLGAKHFKVTYKEEKTSFSEKKVSKKVTAKPIASIDVEQNNENKKYSTVEIAAEMECPGHTPVKPKLKYMKYDPSINGLVEMRMNEHAPLLHQKFMLKLSNSSGLKESEAIKIDAVLKGMKCTGNATVLSETQNESRRYLEYEIGF
ncbi:hypothetical protein ABE547_14560 [Dorea sp. YH-dor226]|uniref:hypothetical protein n=1 Tax=Dorea sp. YH-dor226 TaxID=3151119 RepID=UPI003242C31D